MTTGHPQATGPCMIRNESSKQPQPLSSLYLFVEP